MRPTTEEQLLGVCRLLDELRSDAELSDDSTALVVAATKQLHRVASSVGSRSAFLRWDNDAMITLLGDATPATLHETDEDARNEQLRVVLTETIDALPDDDTGSRFRLAIVSHLRDRVAANPALQKNPQRPWVQESPSDHSPTSHD